MRDIVLQRFRNHTNALVSTTLLFTPIIFLIWPPCANRQLCATSELKGMLRRYRETTAAQEEERRRVAEAEEAQRRAIADAEAAQVILSHRWTKY